MIDPCGRRWSATGKLPTRAISRSNMKSTATMLCSITRNRASEIRSRHNIQEEPNRPAQQEAFYGPANHHRQRRSLGH